MHIMIVNIYTEEPPSHTNYTQFVLRLHVDHVINLSDCNRLQIHIVDWCRWGDCDEVSFVREGGLDVTHPQR